ncbi:protein of unknown function DUF1700 [Paenibacillus curdlanolyticus YK9]|uniref:DUF1700 domain-containing protein n=1 Tax=Paenibacillus curdlanolyticus YK9 TaxID=717606 RepID=E0IGH5_9BACL|nr:DUF1700 domain-containing protein [Paenibacillus curdlanolyticus]EFM08415.1 protein of unknown function DUF1700 [Paenibacillus curdlanolyticus YK9]
MTTGTQYLQMLEHELKGVPEPLRREWLADYAEHFRLAIENGQPEADICLELGDPRDIARELKLNVRMEKASKSGSLVQLTRVMLVGTSLGVFNLLFVLAPFIAVSAVIVALWAVVAAFFGSALLALWGGFVQDMHSGIAGISLACVTTGLGILFGALTKVLTRWFVRGTSRYLQANRRLIQESSRQ